MKELIILLLLAVAGYLAYDDYYKLRPALAHAGIQIRQNPAYRVYVTTQGSGSPAWFQKHLDQGSLLELSRRHTHQGEIFERP